MNYKEYKQKQKEDLEIYKQKLKADLDEFKEKLKIKLEKFKLKTKAKTKNNKKKSNKRKRKGGALSPNEKQLILKFVNEVILKNLPSRDKTEQGIINYLLLNDKKLIESEKDAIRDSNYTDLNILISTALASNRGDEREEYYVTQLRKFLIEKYGSNAGKALTKHFIMLSICGNYEHTQNIYNIVYCLYQIIEDIINITFSFINFLSINSKQEIYSKLQSDDNSNIIELLNRYAITGDMLKEEIILSLCRLLIPYPDEYIDDNGIKLMTINGMKHEAIKDYILDIAKMLNPPSRPIPEHQGEGIGREDRRSRFFEPVAAAPFQDQHESRGNIDPRSRRFFNSMEVAEDQGYGRVRDRLRGAVEIGRQISSEDDKRTKDRGMICRIDEP